MIKYNGGYSNFETYSVADTIENDEELQTLIKPVSSFEGLLTVYGKWISNITTPDGIRFDSKEINHDEINQLIAELKNS